MPPPVMIRLFIFRLSLAGYTIVMWAFLIGTLKSLGTLERKVVNIEEDVQLGVNREIQS